jgi:hypothetical protein
VIDIECVMETLAVNLWVESMETKQKRFVFPFHFGCDLENRLLASLRRRDLGATQRDAHKLPSGFGKITGLWFLDGSTLCSLPHQICMLEDNRSQSPSACQAALSRPHHFLFCLEIQPRLQRRGGAGDGSLRSIMRGNG